MKKVFALVFLTLIVCSVQTISAQTTEFTYQGSLKDGASSANGNYDFEFKLFDLVSGGSQQGGTVQRLNVAVANGIFTVQLDFGAGTLPGADRFLDIGVRTAGGGAFTALGPRQRVNSAPYSVKSLNSTNADTATNATQLGGVAANQFVVTTDPRMTNERPPTAGSGSYIQNTAVGQGLANFAFVGNGTVVGTLTGNTVNAVNQYNLNGSRILSNVGTGNLFAGNLAGGLNGGSFNSFFGRSAGQNNSSGLENSFFGESAGLSTTTGDFNAFFGRDAGRANTTATSNTFIGHNTGSATTTGVANTFLGKGAGTGNTTGTNNTLIGYNAEVGSNSLTFATAIGAGAVVNQSGTIVLGRSTDDVVVPGTVFVDRQLYVTGDLEVEGYALVDQLLIASLGSGGSVNLCRNITSQQVGTCSSSLRYKTNLGSFSQGLSLVKRLRPITFDWKDGGMHDLGLGAEDVAAIEPLLVTYNHKGQVEGVKYDRIGVVLVNAVKEQQSQIETQRKQIEQQQSHIDTLTKLVCASNKEAEICREK